MSWNKVIDRKSSHAGMRLELDCGHSVWVRWMRDGGWNPRMDRQKVQCKQCPKTTSTRSDQTAGS